MKNNFDKWIKAGWLALSFISLVLPAALQSSTSFETAMNATIVVMLVLTLPISLVGGVLFVGLRFVLEMQPDSLFNTYFYLVLINLLGYLQWFWIAPKVIGGPKEFSLPTILDGAGN
jgi:hypothetical protein